MDAAHIHLMLNHVPVLGAVFGAVLLGVGLLRSDESWQRIALWTLLVTGVASVVVYLTGEPAEGLVEGAAGFSHDAVERHEEIAEWAMYTGGAVGAASLGAIGWFRSRPLPRGLMTGVFVLNLALVGVMAWTAQSGGKVSHPELRVETAAAVRGGGEAGSGAPAAGGEAEHEGDQAGEADEHGAGSG